MELETKKYYKSKNYSCIPPEHKCNTCFNDRDTVNFQVYTYKGTDKTPYVAITCLMCRYDEGYLSKSDYKKQKREKISSKIKDYFMSLV